MGIFQYYEERKWWWFYFYLSMAAAKGLEEQSLLTEVLDDVLRYEDSKHSVIVKEGILNKYNGKSGTLKA